jgi:hypothetical protein
MNRVFIGYANVEETGFGGCTDDNNCSYDADAAFDDGSCGSGVYTCGDGTSGCGCGGECGDTLEPPTVEDCNGICDGGAVTLCNSVGSGGGEYCADAGTEICTESSFNDGGCGAGATVEDINSWYDCNSDQCGTIDPLFGCDGMITWDGGRCYTCWDSDTYMPDITIQGDCTGDGFQWQVATVDDCNENEYGCADVYTDADSCPTYVAEGDVDDGWVPFVSDWDDENGEETNGPDDECSCTASGAASSAEVACVIGDVNADGGWNVLDIVGLANCVLANNCGDAIDGGCAADVNGDDGWNVLDIVSLANCVLANNCGGRVDDASEASLIKKDNKLSFEANGFIGGVEMTLSHGLTSLLK